ncbi:MAG TPA: hypothetical protein VF481_00010, partial [Novosphingobium sp.]
IAAGSSSATALSFAALREEDALMGFISDKAGALRSRGCEVGRERRSLSPCASYGKYCVSIFAQRPRT